MRQFTVEGKLSAAGEWGCEGVAACIVTNTCRNNSSYITVVMIVGCTLLLWFFLGFVYLKKIYISVQVSTI